MLLPTAFPAAGSVGLISSFRRAGRNHLCTDPRIFQAVTVARNSIQQNPERQFQYYLLQFPKKLVLNNEIFSDKNDQDNKIVSQVVPYYSKFDLPVGDAMRRIHSNRCTVFWTIAIHEVENRYAGAAKAKI